MALRELKVCLLGVSGGREAGRAREAGRPGPRRAHVLSAASPSPSAGRRLPAPGPFLKPGAILPT